MLSASVGNRVNYPHRKMFSLFLLGRVLTLDVTGHNLKSQPSTLKSVALRYFFEKSLFFLKSKSI